MDYSRIRDVIAAEMFGCERSLKSRKIKQTPSINISKLKKIIIY